jgi:dolichyl-phosphate beta-glucosyltransferase
VTLPRLTIVVPTYNEARRLESTLATALAFAASSGGADLVVVDDGSTDATVALAEAAARRHPELRVRRLPHRGKGHAVRHGVLEATGDWILVTDADLSTPLEDARVLMAAAAANQAVVAIGSRAIDRSLVGVRQRPWREWSGRLFNVVMRRVAALPFRDTQCGFKLYRIDAARAIFSRQRLDGFAFDVEALVIARQLGLPVVEVPVRWNNVPGSRVSVASGARAFGDLWRIRRRARRGEYR